MSNIEIGIYYYEDEDGRLIPYDYPMFQHDLECELDNGYFHIVVFTDEDHIISYNQGRNADGDGEYWDLSNLNITYGKDPFINSLYGQY